MTSALGIWNHLSAAGQTLKGTTVMDTGTGGTSGTSGTGGSSSSSSDDSATISANDFLTLLVTEMQNQDPTADTDPNEYINQLVQVNSLEQLISINQTLTTDSDGTSASPTGSAKAPESGEEIAGVAAQVTSALGANSALTAGPVSGPGVAATHSAQHAFGNLSIPGTDPAAQRVGQSLAGHPRGT
jgi:flagellar basal-body rod modification protein FlgD